jgi:hypothetical protein
MLLCYSSAVCALSLMLRLLSDWSLIQRKRTLDSNKTSVVIAAFDDLALSRSIAAL